MPAAWAAGAAAIGGALISSSAARSASSAQADSTAAGIGEQARQYDITRSDYAPYRAAGTQALGQLQSEMDKPINPADVTNSPGYEFGLQQGQLGLDRKAAAGGGRVSGAALKSAAEYATNYATTGYSAEYQRRQDRLNRLASIANIGQTATNGSAMAGTAAANNVSGLMTAQGNAAGAGMLAQGNIWGNAINRAGAQWSRPVDNNGGYNGVTGYTGNADPLGDMIKANPDW